MSSPLRSHDRPHWNWKMTDNSSLTHQDQLPDRSSMLLLAVVRIRWCVRKRGKLLDKLGTTFLARLDRW